MVLTTVRARWVEASYINQPEARCGHSAVAVESSVWGGEFVVRQSPPPLLLLACASASRLLASMAGPCSMCLPVCLNDAYRRAHGSPQVVFGGINGGKEALDDLVVLQVGGVRG